MYELIITSCVNIALMQGNRFKKILCLQLASFKHFSNLADFEPSIGCQMNI